MTLLTYWDVQNVAAQIISEYGPDYKYGPVVCTYVTHPYDSRLRRPSCFAGIVLFRLGVSLERLASQEDIGNGPAACLFTHGDMGEFRVDDKAATFLTRFQELQDRQVPWGECMSQANTTASDDGYFDKRHQDVCQYMGES